MSLRVKVISRPSVEKLTRNIDFGTAVGLTKTAGQAQAAVLQSLHGTFTLRGTWFQKNMRHGIKITAAKKDNLSASVHTLADWLLPHEEGKTRKPQSGKYIAVPTEQVRRNKRAIIPRAQRPRGLGGKAFVLQTKKGPVLAQRITRGKRKGLIILYGLETSTRIRKQSTFREPIGKVVNKNLRRNIVDGIHHALATMK